MGRHGRKQVELSDALVGKDVRVRAAALEGHDVVGQRQFVQGAPVLVDHHDILPGGAKLGRQVLARISGADYHDPHTSFP